MFAAVSDLSTYPKWLGIVLSAEREDAAVWRVELGARLGPLRRAKTLRMARTEHDPAARRVRFERDEADGKEHSAWVLDGHVAHEGAAATLTMRLYYGGSLWLPGLTQLLEQEIRRAPGRLYRLLAD